MKNSVTRMDTQAYPDNLPCEIRNVKAYGPPRCPLFSDLQAAAVVVHPAPVAHVSVQDAEHPLWVPAKTYGAAAQCYMLKKVADSVATVAVAVLREAMINLVVPGVQASSNKQGQPYWRCYRFCFC